MVVSHEPASVCPEALPSVSEHIAVGLKSHPSPLSYPAVINDSPIASTEDLWDNITYSTSPCATLRLGGSAHALPRRQWKGNRKTPSESNRLFVFFFNCSGYLYEQLLGAQGYVLIVFTKGNWVFSFLVWLNNILKVSCALISAHRKMLLRCFYL